MMSFLLRGYRFEVQQKSVFSFREDEFVVGFRLCRRSGRGRSDDSIEVGDAMLLDYEFRIPTNERSLRVSTIIITLISGL
jgi:hypothetical protein